jgi:hypothetical protein
MNNPAGLDGTKKFVLTFDPIHIISRQAATILWRI